MKRFRQLYYIFCAAIFTLTACQSDLTDDPAAPKDNRIVSVKINVSPASDNVTRAVGDWMDGMAADHEMMNLWTVVIVDANTSQVVEILTCNPTDKSRETDNFMTDLQTGKYIFYSFANIGASYLDRLLSFTPGTVPVPETDDVIISKKPTGVSLTPETAAAATVNSVGNKFLYVRPDNGFGSQGIPMSNKQTIDVAGQSIELIVVRMFAAIELQLYNDRDADVEIESITLTDITDNGTGFMFLLPKYTTASSANTMNAVHGDIKPNLTPAAATTDVVLDYTGSPLAVSAEENSYAKGKQPKKITFYVNESETPINEPTNFSHFFLKIKVVGEEEARYVLIDDKGETTADDKKWNYIARNDYRIIPIVLDDYKLDIKPYDFPAIGVYPASVKEEDGIYTINFHDYGHFHLQPVVTKYSSPDTYVEFTRETPAETIYSKTTWGLVENNFAQSWGSWKDATIEEIYDNATGGFYRTGNNDTKDGDEAGGVPVWYENTSSPVWSTDGTYKGPFIFGYIADPGEKINVDKKVYHEFSIYLYKQGMSAPRQMTYRLYMILDTEQMMYQSRGIVVPTSRHAH